MRRSHIRAIIALQAVLLLTGAQLSYAQTKAAAKTVRYAVAPQGNEVRFRVREQLARIDFPSDAVGTSTNIQGGIVVNDKGVIVKEQSRFIIDLASLKTDSDRRDNFVRRRTLQTEQFPNAEFVPTQIKNLRFPLPTAGDVAFQLIGDLTIRGVTRPVTWDVTAKVANGSISGEARTQLKFADLQLEKPKVMSVLSVDDDIRLEYTFLLTPAPQ